MNILGGIRENIIHVGSLLETDIGDVTDVSQH